jgi:hypothetical protein
MNMKPALYVDSTQGRYTGSSCVGPYSASDEVFNDIGLDIGSLRFGGQTCFHTNGCSNRLIKNLGTRKSS